MGHTLKGVAGALLLLGTIASPARAGFTITLAPGSPIGAGPFTYSYTATIPAGDQIAAGDFFRIYDFNGYVAGSITAPNADWTASVASSNPTPPPNVILSHGDDPAIPNLVFTYTGAAPIIGAATIPGFTAQSTFGFLGAIKDFAGRDRKSDGSFVDSVGDVRVQGPVPEPASVVSLLFGGAVIAFAGRRYCKAKLTC
jgi:hypothetical protein